MRWINCVWKPTGGDLAPARIQLDAVRPFILNIATPRIAYSSVQCTVISVSTRTCVTYECWAWHVFYSCFFFFLAMKHSEGVGVNDVPLLFQVFSSWYLCVGWKISASVCYISCFCCSVGKKPGKAIWRRYADLMKIASENALFSFRLMSWANGFQLFKSKP